MRMFKKAMALTVAVLMLLTSMTITSFAATITDENDDGVVWLYTSNSTGKDKTIETDSEAGIHVWKNGTETAGTTTGRTLTVRSGPLVAPSGAPDNYSIIRMGLTSSYTKKTGIQYPVALDGTYKVYVDHTGSYTTPEADIVVEINDVNGKHTATLKNNKDPRTLKTSGHYGKMVELGTFTFSAESDCSIGCFMSLNYSYRAKADNKTAYGVEKDDFLTIGGIKLVKTSDTRTTKYCYPYWHAAVADATDGTEVAGFIGTENESADVISKYGWSRLFWRGSQIYATTKDKADGWHTSSATFKDPDGNVDTTISRGLGTSAFTETTGIWFKPQLSNTTDSWYDLYIQTCIANNATNTGNLFVEVVHDTGSAYFNVDLTKRTDQRQHISEYVKLGTFKLSNSNGNRVCVMIPLTAPNYVKDTTTGATARIGGIKCVPVSEPTEKEYYNPVESLNVSGEESCSDWTFTGDGAGYETGSNTVVLPADTSMKLVAADANTGTFEFDNVAIDFAFAFRYKDSENSYYAVKIGKDADSYAEIRIYNNKLSLFENDKETIIPLYDRYYIDRLKAGTGINGLQNTTETTGGFWKNMRIEITDPDAYGEYKDLNVIFRNKESVGRLMGSIHIPADSCLNDLGGENSYIELRNVPGTYIQTNTDEEGNETKETVYEKKNIHVNNFSILKPDGTITAGTFQTIDTPLAYDPTTKTSTYKKSLVYPMEISDTVARNNPSVLRAIAIAAYDEDKNICGLDYGTYRTMSGTRNDVELSLDLTNANAANVKAFVWENLTGDLTPVQAAEELSLSSTSVE